jgi:C_GCAxxG_C_C family probable redox protein
MNRIEDVSSLFEGGYNCAQSILSVFGADLGIDRETALRIAGAFGGGMGETGGTCGAVSGAIMVIGLKYASPDAADREARNRTYDAARRFIENFIKRNNTVVCRELLRCESDIKERSSMRDIYSNCPRFVRDASEIIEEILKD